jgi:murein DD-endopeptidase MepM/ murein hydrolase activator NlpD
MSRVAELLCSRCVPRLAALALISFGVAGCSGDMSSRLSQDPFSNPFGYQPEATGAVPAPQVERRELQPYARPQSPNQSSDQSSSLPRPAVSVPQSYPVASSGVSGGGRGIASYTPPAQPKLETTGTVAPRSVAAARPTHPVGSTTIIVGTSDTLELLAQRYHVTLAAILEANGYRGPRTLSPGQQLIIPHSPVVAAAPPVAVAPARQPIAVASAAPGAVHIVNPGETLASIAYHNHITVGELARANSLDLGAKLKLGTRLNVPSKAAATAAPATVAVAPVAAPGTRVAVAAPPQSARLAQANPAAEDDAPQSAVKASEATGALPTFRWPVRGKVITSYGAKTNGKANDGINLAVPEGTPVKAAEDGVVAYAGNELKGYGNLVLVRHANGYVTAYAHASELLVKRGDPIKRGQVIAKSGQSGEVASPQLHFEIRKGSTPVDPLQFLNGA